VPRLRRASIPATPAPMPALAAEGVAAKVNKGTQPRPTFEDRDRHARGSSTGDAGGDLCGFSWRRGRPARATERLPRAVRPV
jgi:hypothetical protein